MFILYWSWYNNPAAVSVLHTIQGSTHLPLKVSLVSQFKLVPEFRFFGVLDKVMALKYVHILIVKACDNAILFAVGDYKHYNLIQDGSNLI